MANLAQIQSIAQGQFFVKDSLGNLTELKVGDTVSLNDTIVAASSNTDLSKIEILFDTNELITLSQGEQLLDTTLLASTFGNEELAFDKQEVDETLNAWNNAQDGDATDMETAAGDVTEQATNAGDERAADGGALRSKFNSRDGDATDIVSDLREASWTGGIERTIEDSENMLLEDPLPVVYTIIEGIDVVNEGDSANYVVKLQDAAGNPVIATQDTIIYVRYTNKTTQDGDTQYNNENIIEVVIKAGTSQTEFTIKTNDDYLADNGEIYNVSITGNNSTEFDMRTGDVAGNKTNVDTTILDNTTINPNEDSNVESDMEQVVLKIVAADQNGKPIKDVNGEYLTVNEVPEGDTAYYVVLAFEPNTTKFNDNTKLDIQSGTVEVKTFDKDATGTTTQTKEDGTQDYVSKTQKVELGKVISVETLDDWKADNGEQYEIKITDKSYEHPTTGAVYENVATDKDPVTTTIKDNTTTNPNNPSTIENNQENVILKIVAVDKDGNPLFEVDGKTFKTTSEVVEGDSAYYKVFAFAPDSKEFNTDTKLPDILQGGTVTVKTGDIGAIGVQSQTANDGSQDYISKTQSDIKVGETIFTVKTIDDYKAETETNETFKVEIENGSYKHPNNDGKDAIYENVTIDPTVATTIIVDNNSTKNADVVVGGSDTNSTTYGAEDTVYAVITANKSSVAEGEVVTHTVKLVDYKGNEVKVSNPTDITIKFFGSTTNPADLKDLLKINGIEVTDTTKDTFTIEIPKDKSSINFTIETKDDAYTEGKESYTLKIEDIDTNEFENIKFNEYTGLDTTKVPNPSNTTTTEINDNSTEVKIVLVAVTSSTTTIAHITDSNGKLIYNDNNITPESGKLYYVAVAVDKDNNVLIQDGKVKVSTYDVADGAKGGNSVKPPLDGSEDYQSLKDKEVSLGEVFDVQTNDDYVRDNNETFTVKIDSIVDGSKYENPSVDTTRDTVTSTITDNDPTTNAPISENPTVDGQGYGKEDTVYVKIVDNAEVVEGGNLVHNIQLIDKDGKSVIIPDGEEITVTLKYTTNHDIKDSDFVNGSNQYNETTKTITVTIDKNTPKDENGIYKLPITNKTQVDFDTEGTEKYQLEITGVSQEKNTYENITIDSKNSSVTGTILDGITLGKPVDSKVDEDNFYQNDLDGTNGQSVTKTNLTASESLGITIPNDYENTVGTYTINFVGNPTLDGVTKLTSDGKDVHFQTIGNKIIGYIGKDVGNGAVNTNNKVFEIVLNKSTGKYNYTQYKNIDHPKSGNVNEANGKENYNDNDNIDLNFKFNITTTSKNGQTVTSDPQDFKVTVNDSTPIAGEQNLVVYEDNSLQFIISDGGFKGNTIEISNDGGNKYKTLTTTNGSNSIDILENGQKIGTLTNKGDGKLEFKPAEDYSKYTNDNLPNFKYKVYDTDGDYAEGKVNIKVKPVADAPTVTVKNIETTEDYNNTQEGTNKVALELKVPSLSKDQTDKNNATGDSPERNGEITLKFTNGTNVKGAKLYSGDTKVADISTNNQPIKVVIVKTSGGTDIDTTYHHSGTLPVKGGNVLYLTKEEYESLKIQHAEDNDTNIQINIGVTSYEVNDNGEPLFKNSSYDDNNNSNLYKNSNATMTVVIKPVTDDISLKWNDKSAGTISDAGKTYTFNDINEGNPTIDLKALLTKTSGTETFDGSKADLDGSEKRTYTISGIPEGTVVTLGGQTAVANDKGIATIVFNDTNNKNKNGDPDFSMKFPENYSGRVEGKITLSVQDKGFKADGTTNEDQVNWGEVKTAEVNFKVNVNPVADDATVKVGQPVGYEDAGRSLGNTSTKEIDASKIDKPGDGIKLPITVTSTDKDGSETFTVTIKDIPNGSGLYVYDKSSVSYKLVEVSNVGTITIDGQAVTGDKSGNISVTLQQDGKFAVEIKDYQNTEQPKFIPPHNSHGDFDLKVDAKTVDTVIIGENPVASENTTAIDKPIKVVVKDLADSVVGNDYNKKLDLVATDADDKVVGIHEQYNAIVNEDDNGGKISLNSIFKYSTKLSSYDKESEDLTIILKSLPKGVELEGNVTLINGQYIFKADDISGIKIVTPPNYSGELNFDITYITTEKGEANNPSKTHNSTQETNKISIFVKPTIDAQFDSQTTKAEDSEIVDGGNSYYKVDLGISHQNGDNDETLESVTIKAPEANSGYKLFIIDGNTKTEITSDYTLKTTELNKVYVEVKENQHGSFDIKGTYTVKDSQYAGKDVNYETKETKDFTHKLTITPVTDTPTITVETGTQTHINVNAEKNTEIKIPVKVSSVDKDGSENITKIVISGVPQGVTVDGLGFEKLFDENGNSINVSLHNGIYTITGHGLNSDSFKDIVFNVGANADFEHRDITITAFTKDAEGSKEEQTSTKITLDKIHNGTGTGEGPTLGIEIKDTNFTATEDTQFNFLDVFKVVVTDGGRDGRTELNFKIDVGSNATLKGLDAYKNTDGSYTIKGNRADIESVLANLKVVPNKDYNDNHTTDKSTLDITVTIDGKTPVIAKVPVVPVTDAMSIKVEATPTDLAGIVENKPVDLKITLINSVDGKHTEEIKSITIKVTETWKDNAIGEVTEKGLLTDTRGNYKINENLDGTYTITKKDGTSFDFTEIKDLQYTPTTNRNGDVSFDVIVNHKEIDGKATMDTLEDGSRNAIGSKVITVKPVVSSEIKVGNVQDGVEDEKMASIELNVVKADPSEKFESVLIKVASGVAIYYNEGKSLAMNLGDGSWLVPVNSDGTLPQIFFKGNEHFGGEIKFDAIINVKDGDSKVSSELIKGSVTITEVVDGVTIDPTKTGIDKNAFEWTSLNLNANMKDVDGSEKMYLTLEGLNSSAQFRVVDKDGNLKEVNSTYDEVTGKWSVEGVAYDDINNLQITSDKSTKVKVEAWTKNGEDLSQKVSGEFDLAYKQSAVKDGILTLGKEVNIDFSKIANGDIQGVSKIDLGAEGENKLLNLTLDDVLSIGKKDGSGNINLDILGGTDDKVSFAKDNGWKKADSTVTEKIGEDTKTFEIYTNSGDPTVQVKVEQPISDGITN